MNKMLLAFLTQRFLLGPDDGAGDGGAAPDADGGAPQESSQPEIPQGSPEPQQAAPEQAWDPRAAYDDLAKQNAQYQRALQEMYGGIQENNKRWGEMQGIFKRMAGVEDPKTPEWQQPMQHMYGSLRREMQNYYMEQRLRDELPMAEKEAAEFFKIYGPEDGRRILTSLWSGYADKNGAPHRSILDTARMLNAPYKKALESALAEQQKKYVQQKQGQQKELRGSGPAGSAPPPNAGKKQGKQGFAASEISDDDVRQAMDELRGMTD